MISDVMRNSTELSYKATKIDAGWLLSLESKDFDEMGYFAVTFDARDEKNMEYQLVSYYSHSCDDIIGPINWQGGGFDVWDRRVYRPWGLP